MKILTAICRCVAWLFGRWRSVDEERPRDHYADCLNACNAIEDPDVRRETRETLEFHKASGFNFTPSDNPVMSIGVGWKNGGDG